MVGVWLRFVGWVFGFGCSFFQILSMKNKNWVYKHGKKIWMAHQLWIVLHYMKLMMATLKGDFGPQHPPRWLSYQWSLGYGALNFYQHQHSGEICVIPKRWARLERIWSDDMSLDIFYWRGQMICWKHPDLWRWRHWLQAQILQQEHSSCQVW